MRKLKIFAVFVLLCSILLSAGCQNKPTEAPTAPPSATKPSETKAPAEKPTEAPTETPTDTPSEAPTDAPTEEPTNAPTEPTAGPDPEDASLVSFRQAMVGTSEIFAAGFFGYHYDMDTQGPVDPIAAMAAEAPQLCQNLPFLLSIPQERIVGNGTGDLFCIVPRDEDASVAITRGTWDHENSEILYTEVLYRSESGEPILLMCNDTGWEPDTQVVITASDGTVAQWYPQITQMRCIDLPVNENGEQLLWDFSPYAESLSRAYLEMSAEDWELPTREDLIGITWGYTTWTAEGMELNYRLTFHEDVCSVSWNDSFDGVQHEFTDAAWQLRQENGMAVLSVDFREFAGVLQYDLLLDREYEMLYVAVDVSEGVVQKNVEPLYQYLQVVGTGNAPDPSGMIGKWGLSWTEVEGDYCPMLPDDMILEISQGSTPDNFFVSCTNNLRAESSFYDESTVVIPGEMYSGCGNSEWMAEVDYMDDLGTFYYITLLEDGTLLMQQLWYVDDAPMVSYLGFERAD